MTSSRNLRCRSIKIEILSTFLRFHDLRHEKRPNDRAQRMGNFSSETRESQTFSIKYTYAFPSPNHFSSFLARSPRHPFKALATSERRGGPLLSFCIFFLFRCRGIGRNDELPYFLTTRISRRSYFDW